MCATLLLFDLTRKVLRDDYLAYKSALLFTINPASVFFSAAYSESLHALLSFYLMLKLEKAFTIQSGLLLALCSSVRSNGLLNLGFAAYKSLRLIAREIAIHQRLKQLQREDFAETLANIIGDAVLPGILSALMSFLPFVMFQWYAFTQYCGVTKPKFDYDEGILDYARDHGLILPSADPSSWCQDSPPIPYFYIQSHYWNVGFLKYFQLKQLPNFFLAAPVLYLTASHCLRFFECHKFYCSRLGFTYFNMDPSQKVPAFDMYKARILPKECFVYMAHAAFLCFFGTFFVHVQISTRMILSSSPVVFWVCALVTTPEEKKAIPLLDLDNKPEMALKLESPENLESAWRSLLMDERWTKPESKWIRVYFLSYALLGTILFSNFLPWT